MAFSSYDFGSFVILSLIDLRLTAPMNIDSQRLEENTWIVSADGFKCKISPKKRSVDY
jgi:hypothetical protein